MCLQNRGEIKYPWLINTKLSLLKTTALYLAVTNGHVETCRLLLSKSNPEDINRSDSDGNTMLHKAVENHHYEICQILIPEMSLESINQSNNKGQTALGLLKKNSCYDSWRNYSTPYYSEERKLIRELVFSLTTCESYGEIVASSINEMSKGYRLSFKHQ